MHVEYFSSVATLRETIAAVAGVVRPMHLRDDINTIIMRVSPPWGAMILQA